MGKKRKSERTVIDDEIDRAMYSSFCGAASSLSQLYSQASSQQKLPFRAGERHALEKMYEWMVTREREHAGVTVADIFLYLQSYLGGIEPAIESGQNEKNSAYLIPQELSQLHLNGSTNSLIPLESEMDTSQDSPLH